MIQWKDEYAIGMDVIDEQHKRIFDIANRAYTLLKNELVTDKYDAIVEIVNELKEYTIYHFQTEEAHMQGIGYRRYFSQKIAHDNFLLKMDEVDLSKVDEDHNEYLLELLEFVTNWLLQHILKQDKLIVTSND